MVTRGPSAINCCHVICNLCTSDCRASDREAANKLNERARALAAEQRKSEVLTESWTDNVAALKEIMDTPLDDLVVLMIQ